MESVKHFFFLKQGVIKSALQKLLYRIENIFQYFLRQKCKIMLVVDHRSCGNCIFLKERYLVHMGLTLSGRVLYVSTPVSRNPSILFGRCCMTGLADRERGK